jgi:hypothetical protein
VLFGHIAPQNNKSLRLRNRQALADVIEKGIGKAHGTVMRRRGVRRNTSLSEINPETKTAPNEKARGAI